MLFAAAVHFIAVCWYFSRLTSMNSALSIFIIIIIMKASYLQFLPHDSRRRLTDFIFQFFYDTLF